MLSKKHTRTFFVCLFWIVAESLPFSFLKSFYFLFGCAGPSLLGGLFSSCSQWGLLSRVGAGFSLWWLFLLQSRDSRAHGPPFLWHLGLGVVAHGLSCPEAYGIFPAQGSNLSLLHWQLDYLPSQQGRPYLLALNWFVYLLYFTYIPKTLG